MTIIFPDVSEYNGGYNFAGHPIAIARATIGTVKDQQWDRNKISAAASGCRLAAYAFLNAPSLGRSVDAQADYAYSVIGQTPAMLDLEPNRGACASFADGLAFIARYRSHGGVLHLCYLPKWAWSGNMGSPSLTPLTSAGVGLVSSRYTTYSDVGPGWDAYGGVTPIQWQYTDSLNGTGADGNAYKGTADQWWAMATGGTQAVTRKDEDMLVMAHVTGSNEDWAGNGVFRFKVADAAHKANLLVVMGLAGDPNPRSVEFNPGTLDALGPVVVDATGVPTTVAFTGTQVSVLASTIAASVVGGHDALSSADLAGVQASAAQAIRDVLGGLG